MNLRTRWRRGVVVLEYAYSNNALRLPAPSRSLPPPSALFSTSTKLLYPPPMTKKPGGGREIIPPKRGAKIVLKKKKRPTESKGRHVAPGERKAFRKRVVLSNTNAIEVLDMPELSPETMLDVGLRGQVIGIPGLVVDQLRAVEAFKASQNWGFSRKPGTLIRQETVEMGQLLMEINEQPEPSTVRKVFVGTRASGKSAMLLQAMAMAFVNQWVVINIPEAQDLSIGHTEYSHLSGSSPPQYIQKSYLSSLLARIARANPMLSDLSISQPHSLPIPIQPNISLNRLALLGSDDPDLAHPIFRALWKELTTSSTSEHPRPKILLTLDGLGHVMKTTAYLSATLQPIHAHDLTLVRWFMDYLSGRHALPNGGMVLAATSESNHPNVPALRFRLAQLEMQQNPPNHPSPVGPFLLATGQELDPMPTIDPYARYDVRVLETFPDGEERVGVQRIEGLRKEEARGLMEFWARSGLLRATLSEGLVGEKWTVSGGGVIGELERGCITGRV